MSKENYNVLTVVDTTEILGRKIDLYGSIESPLFKATDVAEWIEHSKVSMMLKSIDEEEKVKVNNAYSDKRTGGNGTWFVTEDGLYEICMQSRKDIAKQMKKEIKKYLKLIRTTGGVVELNREDVFVENYLGRLSEDTKIQVIKELHDKNEELQKFYDDVLNTEGLYHMNIVAKELAIGRNTMFSYLRSKKVMFYQDGVNVPYQRFMNEQKFAIKETPCNDGVYRPVTYATKKGMDYIRRLLRKDGYYETVNS